MYEKLIGHYGLNADHHPAVIQKLHQLLLTSNRFLKVSTLFIYFLTTVGITGSYRILSRRCASCAREGEFGKSSKRS